MEHCDRCLAHIDRIKRNEEDIVNIHREHEEDMAKMDRRIENMVAWVRGGMMSLIVGVAIVIIKSFI